MSGGLDRHLDSGGGDLVPGVLRGFRCWALPLPGARQARGLPLASIRRPGLRWTQPMRAGCDVDPDHEAAGAPVHGCTCGLYAWYLPRNAVVLPGTVFGVIEASGRVLMADRGFRAERARVRAVASRDAAVVAACRRAGIETFRTRRQLLRAYPADDVSALIPPPPRHRRGLLNALAALLVTFGPLLAVAATAVGRAPALVTVWFVLQTLVVAALTWRVARP